MLSHQPAAAGSIRPGRQETLETRLHAQLQELHAESRTIYPMGMVTPGTIKDN